ncbi:MFS transporter [Actinomadura spongiicola]|uniref:hypothetical protein n=1 Tax=Actinomadura spongiicola TaxID=2303421 RepID=UPI0018F19104|nr:hypothetical protein [Actinomadura spongiicola]
MPDRLPRPLGQGVQRIGRFGQALGPGHQVAQAVAVRPRRGAEPLLPAAVFADRDRAAAFLNLLLLALVLTSFLVYLVQYLQGVLRLDALESGLGILPFGLALLVTTQRLTKRLVRIDLKARAAAGLVLLFWFGPGARRRADGPADAEKAASATDEG